MEAELTSVWSEESETIAHLQSMFWSNMYADVNLPSPNISTDSCVTTSTMPSNFPPIQSECYSALVNTAVDWSLVQQTQTVAATTDAVVGDKRILPMDEMRNDCNIINKKPCTPAQVPRIWSSNTLNDDASTHLSSLSSSRGYSSGDDSNGLCELSVALKQRESSRDRKCSSKNLQSLYAKKRRERINEKLKILQQLIPNGTKVDISTMLEEAVQYVKFLQLQIKLLSSDEAWMYASLAYNGVGIDLDASTTYKS